MKLGVNLGYWGLGMGPQDQLQVVQEAERLGYDSVWAAEAYGSDAATVLAWLAAGTTKIKLGSAIFQMPGRTPALTAMTAATIDELSGGRMILGIGSSGPQVAEGWHGQRFAPPAPAHARVRGRRPQGAGPRAPRVQGRDARAAAARRPRQGAEADDHPRAGAHPDLPGRDRPQEHGAGRRDRRRLDPDLLLPRARGRLPRAAEEGAARSGRSLDGSTSPPRCSPTSPTTARWRATLCARCSPCTSAVWARASRTSTTTWSSATASRTPPRRSRIYTWTARRPRPARRSPTS